MPPRGGIGFVAVEEGADALAAVAADLEQVGDGRVDHDAAGAPAGDHARPRENVVTGLVDPLRLEADLVPLAVEALQIALDVLDAHPNGGARDLPRVLPHDLRRQVVDDPGDIAAIEAGVPSGGHPARLHRGGFPGIWPGGSSCFGPARPLPRPRR